MKEKKRFGDPHQKQIRNCGLASEWEARVRIFVGLEERG